MADDAELAVLTYFIAAFALVNVMWTVVNIWQWGKEQCNPPEAEQHFNGKYALMLEEIFRATHDLESATGVEELVRKMHKATNKRRPDGTRLIFMPQSVLDDLAEIRAEVVSIRKRIKRNSVV